MRIGLLAAVIASLLATHAQTQSTPRPSDQSQSRLAIVARISNDLKAKKLKIGDKVSAQVLQDLVAGGRILVPRDSKLTGHVVEVASFTKDDPRSRLALVFDRAHAKGGNAIVIYGVIQAVAPPLPDSFLDDVMSSSSSTYTGSENGHPVYTPNGQVNSPTPIIRSARDRTAAGALQQRERALNNAAGDSTREASLPGGALSSGNRGIFRLPGLFLANSNGIPVIVAVGQNVDLKSGTQVVLTLDRGLF